MEMNNIWREPETKGAWMYHMQHPGLILKSIAWLVIFAFIWHAGVPLAEAAANGTLLDPPVNQSVQLPQGTTVATEEDEFAETVEEIDEKIAELSGALATHDDESDEQEELLELEAKLKGLAAEVLANFDAQRADLVAQKLPAEILARHDEMVAQFNAELQTLYANIQAITAAATPAEKQASAEKAKTHLEEKSHKRKSDFDPNDLPSGIRDGKETRKPIETEDGYKVSGLFEPKGVAVAALGSIALPANAGSKPTSQDLAATTDVQITQPIKDLAASLENNPVKIYNWVHDNIQFMPTYGSIQGSDMTLQTKKGNAFDTASLLISLLRAAGIHARYGYGTVQIPIEKVMNWVGGVTDPIAATNLLSQGGIPSVALVQSGKVIAVKMEHVWVEAWVDYIPSRAAKNKVGDSWIPMDASFKQYSYTKGMDLQTAVPFDAYAFSQQITAGSQIDPVLGSATGIDTYTIQTTINSYQAQLLNHINTIDPYASVDDILGAQAIIPSELPHLASSLPYKIVARGAAFAALADNMRHKFQFTFYGSQKNQMLGTTTFDYSGTFPDLVGKQITFGFAPATAADEALIDSYLPQPHLDGSPILSSEFPASLPGYLIHLKAELRIDGQVVASGGDFTMGQDVFTRMGLIDPIFGGTYANNSIVSGEYQAIGLDPGTISEAQLEGMQESMRSVSTVIAQGAELIAREDSIGRLFSGGIWSYFAMLDQQRERSARQAGVQSYRLPSFGMMGARMTPTYFFGIPRNVSSSGVFMDVDKIMDQLVANDNDQAKARNFMINMGMYSSGLEHSIPEMMFSDPVNPIEAVSTMKLLQKAAMQGQMVYTIDKSNVSAVLPLLGMSAETETEVSGAVAAGKIVTTHQSAITIDNWTGFGYAIIDSVTGAGAYKISGGSNGSVIAALAWTLLGASQKINLHAAALGVSGGFVDVLKRTLALLAFLLGIVKAFAVCTTEQSIRDMIVSQTFVTLVGLGILDMVAGMAIAAAAMPWVLLAVGFVIAVGSALIMNHLYSLNPNCTARLRDFFFVRFQQGEVKYGVA